MTLLPPTDRIQIDYTLSFSTPFHFGTGGRIGLIDRTIVRDSEGYLYVPGSTIKGVLREQCEQLARLYEETDIDMRERIASPHDTYMALHGFGNTATMVTRIFGSPLQAGTLFFDDARQKEDDKKQYDAADPHDPDSKNRYQNIQVDIYTQARLDRLTRTAVRGALYTSEFGVRDVTFEGRILGGLACTPIDATLVEDDFFAIPPEKEPPSYSLLLLLAGVSLLERLGGNKSAGKGQCRCEIQSVKINDTVQKKWQEWLAHLDALSYYSLAQEG